MERQLYTATSNGFSATCDAFVAKQDSTLYVKQLRLLSIIGGQAATKAIAAGVLKRDAEIVRLTPQDDDWSLEPVNAMRMGDSGPWRTKTMRLPQTKAWHTLVYSTMLEFNREEPNFVLLAEPGATDAMERHLQFLNRRVSLPLHPSWQSWLWERGLRSGEVQPLVAEGLSAWECLPDQDALKVDIKWAVRQGTLIVPEGAGD